MSEKGVSAFQRGLDAGFKRLPQNAKAWMRIEKQRIIELLETAGDCKCSSEYGVDYDNTCYCDAIALIKGEN
jgi:hypothetical protein